MQVVVPLAAKIIAMDAPMVVVVVVPILVLVVALEAVETHVQEVALQGVPVVAGLVLVTVEVHVPEGVLVVALEAAQLDVQAVPEGVLTPVNMVVSGVPRKFL